MLKVVIIIKKTKSMKPEKLHRKQIEKNSYSPIFKKPNIE
jgi:hypothetical protein